MTLANILLLLILIVMAIGVAIVYYGIHRTNQNIVQFARMQHNAHSELVMEIRREVRKTYKWGD